MVDIFGMNNQFNKLVEEGNQLVTKLKNEYSCRHLHLKSFDSNTEYGKLWACSDCPAVFINLPSNQDHDMNLSIEVERKNNQYQEAIIL